MLNWANQFNICCFLDDNRYNQKFNTYECLLGAGAKQIFSPANNILQQLKAFYPTHNDWLFGHINYDLKNEIENLHSRNPDNIGFPTICLFQPLVVIEVKGLLVTISALEEDPSLVFQQIVAQPVSTPVKTHNIPAVKQRIDKNAYISIIQKLRQHILRGDCYEINFCQEFFAEHAEVNPLQLYTQLSHISAAPFSCYYKLDDRYLACASPERYIKKAGNTIISQPIKGTNKRNTADAIKDEQLKAELGNSAKDRSENVMVVDLVRNDLSKICVEGTVTTDELFGIYSFPQVHQMISTISGTLTGGIGLAEVLQATFPMGSMTGAPKKRVMELIEQYEPVQRGIFSGAVGYITPGKDFDFNVVIRSIMYNAQTQYLNYLVGGGITFYSDAENEYEECLLKAQAMQKVLLRH
jgi:para-aminobenzoate synthetase component 1